jgi:hypothetical protein
VLAFAHLGRLGGARVLTRAVLMARFLIPMYIGTVLMSALLMVEDTHSNHDTNTTAVL